MPWVRTMCCTASMWAAASWSTLCLCMRRSRLVWRTTPTEICWQRMPRRAPCCCGRPRAVAECTQVMCWWAMPGTVRIGCNVELLLSQAWVCKMECNQAKLAVCWWVIPCKSLVGQWLRCSERHGTNSASHAGICVYIHMAQVCQTCACYTSCSRNTSQQLSGSWVSSQGIASQTHSDRSL